VIKLTIVYKNKSFPPTPYDQIVLEMLYYRLLYDGEHAKIFPRAKYAGKDRRLKRKRVGYKRWEESFETIDTGDPYIVVNFSSLVAEIPADLLNRALGNISADTETSEDELAFVKAVAEASQINEKIWAAVVSHQVDGSIAYRPRRDESGKVWFEWLLGDQYLPHTDGKGADVAWIEEWGEETNKKRFLRVERHRLGVNVLTVEQLVFKFEGDSVGDEVDAAAYAAEHGAEVPDNIELSGVTELLIGVVTNEDTLYTPRGRSALRNVAEIQEEINWTITRDSIVFEKHGKPKLAIPKGLWDTVANNNNRNYGARFVRNADLEVVSYDENKGAIPMYIVWDAKTEQSFKHVERLIKYMLAVSKTSPQAAGLEEGKGDSGIALLYLWIQSVIKAEAIKDKFDAAIKAAIRKCIILENALGGTNMNPIAPVIEWGDMLPKADSEKAAEEIAKYEAGAQSLEQTVRKIHPDWSEAAIMEEIKKIEEGKAIDSFDPQLRQPPKVTL
jgi:Phage portal protein, SPP1 Gp6-like.